jgi:hypothetical protein
MNKKQIISDLNNEAMFADGFDDAIIGFVSHPLTGYIACYDTDKCIDILMDEGMTESEAHEYFEYNVLGAYVGENTPCFAIIFKD